jgi:signal transduction histidine kinase
MTTNAQADTSVLSPAEVLANVAHELRQPLSNIESIAYYLAMVLPQGDGRAQSELARIRCLVEQSGAILTQGLRRAGYPLSIPNPDPFKASDIEDQESDVFDTRQLCLVLE